MANFIILSVDCRSLSGIVTKLEEEFTKPEMVRGELGPCVSLLQGKRESVFICKKD